MNLLCVLIHKDKSNIGSIIHAVSKQTHVIDCWFLFDRTDHEYKDFDSFKFITVNHDKYVGRPSEELFLSGSVRNYAIDRALELGYRNLIFIDGDCIPDKNLAHSHLKILNKNYPIITFGKRIEHKHGDLDQRELSNDRNIKNIFKKQSGSVFNDYELIKKSSYLWTCNFALNLSAISQIKSFNNFYYGRSEVFNSDISGSYGFEDSFLSVTAFHSNVFMCVSNDEKSGVLHIDHPRPPKKYDLNQFSEYFFEKIALQEMMMKERPRIL